MTSPKNAFLILSVLCILPGVLYAFDISPYLYANEGNVTPSYTNFTLDGNNYSLVAIKGVNTFLLQNDEPLRNQSDIAPVIHGYYAQTYYLSPDDVANLTALITRFNDSRNDGYDFPHREEYSCREDVIFNDKLKTYGTRAYLEAYGSPINCTDPSDNTTCTSPLECRNNVSCTRLASLVGGHYCQADNILCNSQEAIAVVTDFSIASYDMDTILGNYTLLLAGITPDNAADVLSYIKGTAPTLKADSLKVEATELRTPRLNDSADRAACIAGTCYELCPSFQLDQPATDQLAALAATLGSKLAPLKDYQSYAAQVANASAARLDYAKEQSTTAYYADLFRGLNASGSAAIALGNDARTHVANMTLNDNLDQLIALQSTIPEDIGAGNFTGLDADLANYRISAASVRNLSMTLMGVYNDTLQSKNNADSLLLILETRDSLDPSALETFGILQNQTADLDASFRDGYNVEQLVALKQKYDNVSSSAQDLLNSESDVPATRAVLLFRGFARRVNVDIDKFATVTLPGGSQGIIDNRILSFGSFSALVFLSLTSLSLLFFLFLLTSFSLDVQGSKLMVGAAFLCTLVIFLGGSVFLYLFLDRTATSATFTEFLSDFSSRPSAAIVLDLRNVSYSDSQSMVSCGRSLSGVLSADNKTWSLYTLGQNGCTMQKQGGGNSTMAMDACLAGAANQSSTFMLGYAPQTQTPRFSIIYKSEADINANSGYYRSCPLVTLFG